MTSFTVPKDVAISADSQGSTLARRRINETQAFDEARSRFLKEMDHPTAPKPPKRLYDMRLGELTEDTVHKPFIIVSYIWNPQKLPAFPKLGSYSTKNFDAMVLAASKLRDEQGRPILELDTKFEQKLEEVICPAFKWCTSLDQRNYFQEVFALAAAEAADRDLRYIWMDSLCIEQDNDIEKAEEIRYMADYYSQAVCCVVVSEMLRRCYAHSWEQRGNDDAYEHYTLKIYPEIGPTYKDSWGLHDEVVGWIIGYHELRVWVFQETYYAQELVHRGRNIRINTSVALDWDRGYYVTIGSLDRPWHLQSADRKATILRKMHLKYLEEVALRFPTVLDQRKSAESTRLVDGILKEILGQRRSITKPQDAIYGLLSLYPRLIRFSMPVRYDISRIAVLTILIYLRVLSGEVRPLFFDDGHPEFGSHVIRNAPSWLPRHMPLSLTDLHEVDGLCSLNIDVCHNLVVRGQYVPIVGAKWGYERPGEKSLCDYTSEVGGINQECRLWLLPGGVSGFLQWHFLDSRVSTRASTATRRSSEASEIIWGVDHTSTLMTKIGIATLPDGRSFTLWMVLVKVQGQERYLKRGWVNSSDELISDAETLHGIFLIQ